MGNRLPEEEEAEEVAGGVKLSSMVAAMLSRRFSMPRRTSADRAWWLPSARGSPLRLARWSME